MKTLIRRAVVKQPQRKNKIQESRAITRKLCDAAAVCFGVKFAISVGVVTIRKPHFRALEIPS